MGEATLEKQKRNEEVIEKYLSGVTITILAKEYGISRQRVMQLCKRRGMHRDRLFRHINQDIIEDAKKLFSEGVSRKEITSLLDISQPALNKYLGIQKKYRENEMVRCWACKKMKPEQDMCKVKGKASTLCKACNVKRCIEYQKSKKGAK